MKIIKTAKWENEISGGKADKKKPSDFPQKVIEQGQKIEMEHTDDKILATEIVMDHLMENPKYYDYLEKMENKMKKDEKKSANKEAAKKKKKWMQEAVPESHEGKFAAWCKSHGHKGVCQSCINEAIAAGGHSAKMANFAINVSKGKYKHSDTKKQAQKKPLVITDPARRGREESVPEVPQMTPEQLDELGIPTVFTGNSSELRRQIEDAVKNKQSIKK